MAASRWARRCDRRLDVAFGGTLLRRSGDRSDAHIRCNRSRRGNARLLRIRHWLRLALRQERPRRAGGRPPNAGVNLARLGRAWISQSKSAYRAHAYASADGARTGTAGSAARGPDRTAPRAKRPRHSATRRSGSGRRAARRGSPAIAEAKSSSACATKTEQRLRPALARTACRPESNRPRDA